MKYRPNSRCIILWCRPSALNIRLVAEGANPPKLCPALDAPSLAVILQEMLAIEERAATAKSQVVRSELEAQLEALEAQLSQAQHTLEAKQHAAHQERLDAALRLED